MRFNGSALEQARGRAGLTQEQLAYLCGSSGAFISRLERGAATNPRLSTMTKIARALDIPVSDLLIDTATPDEVVA